MDNHELAALVDRAATLRQQLAGRLPERIYWGWKDFLVGTAGMSLMQLGAYVRLLHFQLDKGSVPRGRMEGLLRSLSPDEYSTLLLKFSEHEGSYYNVRCLQEFVAAAEQAIGARERGRRGGKSKSGGEEPYPK